MFGPAIGTESSVRSALGHPGLHDLGEQLSPRKIDTEKISSRRLTLFLASPEKRNLFFAGLPANATHKDLTNIIRGGRLLNIYLRPDKAATVAFVDGAAEFLAYSQQQNLFVHNKKASDSCSLPSHLLTLSRFKSVGPIKNFM